MWSEAENCNKTLPEEKMEGLKDLLKKIYYIWKSECDSEYLCISAGKKHIHMSSLDDNDETILSYYAIEEDEDENSI